MKGQTKTCPLLTRYNYPRALGESSISTWYKTICQQCPLTDACIYDWVRAKIPPNVKKKLDARIIPCPKCEAKDNWQAFEKDGVSCIHCGIYMYWREPIKKKQKIKPIEET